MGGASSTPLPCPLAVMLQDISSGRALVWVPGGGHPRVVWGTAPTLDILQKDPLHEDSHQVSFLSAPPFL